MPKFIVKETLLCWVSWNYEVEAANAEEAEEIYESNGELMAMNVGDSVDFNDGETAIEVTPA